MAERQLPEGWQDLGAKMMGAAEITKAEERVQLVRRASRMIDAIQGNAPDARPLLSNPAGEFASAPNEVPAVCWRDDTPMIPSEGGKRRKAWVMTDAGSVGDYHCDVFPNTLPATVFNTGFYAGVLAVRFGLVDPEQFHADNERTQLTGQEQTPPTE